MVNKIRRAALDSRCPERFPVQHGGRGLRCLKTEGHPGPHGGPGLVNWSTERDKDESEGA